LITFEFGLLEVGSAGAAATAGERTLRGLREEELGPLGTEAARDSFVLLIGGTLEAEMENILISVAVRSRVVFYN